MNWYGDSQIKVATTAPLSTRGPALTVGKNRLEADRLYMVYTGKDGEDLYWSYTDNDDVSVSEFQDWQGNVQIKPLDGGGVLKASDRPAVAFFDDQLYLVYSASDGGRLVFATYDGGWSDAVSVPGFDAHVNWKQPAMAVFNNRLHLVACDSVGSIWYTWKATGAASNWSTPIGIAMAAIDPSLAVNSNELFLLYTGANNKLLYSMTLQQGVDLWVAQPWALQIESNSGPAIAFFNNQLYLVYTSPHGKTTLYYGTFTGGPDVFGSISKVQIESTVAKTDAPPALTVFQGKLCLAHKGNSNDKLYFAYFF
jgi:hypothetical protein